MSTPAHAAEIIPLSEAHRKGGSRGESALRRLPTLDEVPAPSADFRRGEVVVYSGVSFGARANHAYSQSTAPVRPRDEQSPIQRMELFTDAREPGQVYARVMILEPGSPVPREALITPLIAVNEANKRELDRVGDIRQLVAKANIEISRFFDSFGPIDGDVKLKEFEHFVGKRDSLRFLFDNLLNENREAGFNLFSAYFAPGGANTGVGVFVNTWL